MKLTITVVVDDATLEDGGAEELARLLASVAERIPIPPRSIALNLHDATGLWCGTAWVGAEPSHPARPATLQALDEIQRLTRNVAVHPDARNWVQAVHAVATKAIDEAKAGGAA